MRLIAPFSVTIGFVAAALALSGCSPTSTLPPEQEDWDLSEEVLDAQYNALLSDLQVVYELPTRPEGDLVRYVSFEEWPNAQVDCLSGEGVSAQMDEQGGISFDGIPAEQQEALRFAAALCASRYPVDPRHNMVLPRIRAEQQYRFLVETVMPCVEGLGYSVSSPPTMQTWLESYYASGWAWDPISEAGEQMAPGVEQSGELYRTCPTVSEAVYPPMEF